MNTNTRKLAYSALFLALALVLPFITGQIQAIGNMLCPMHIPVLLCGFFVGGPWALVVGIVAPLLRSLLFGMPPFFPIAIAMSFELGTYGLVSGLLSHRFARNAGGIYGALVIAMVVGRLVWGAVRFVLAGLSGGSFPFQAFLSGAVLTAVPGIILQLVLIPALVLALKKHISES